MVSAVAGRNRAGGPSQSSLRCCWLVTVTNKTTQSQQGGDDKCRHHQPSPLLLRVRVHDLAVLSAIAGRHAKCFTHSFSKAMCGTRPSAPAPHPHCHSTDRRSRPARNRSASASLRRTSCRPDTENRIAAWNTSIPATSRAKRARRSQDWRTDLILREIRRTPVYRRSEQVTQCHLAHSPRRRRISNSATSIFICSKASKHSRTSALLILGRLFG